MTYRLASGPRVGDWRTAALIETRHDITAGRHGAWARASVAPVALFLLCKGEVRVADVTGRGRCLAALEGLYPGLAEAVARLG